MGAWIGGMALVWLAVVGVQVLRGWPGWVVRLPVETGQIRPDPKSKGLWKAPVPRNFRGWLTDQRGVVLENGKRVGRRSASISGVMKESGGLYCFHHGFVRWRSADGSDPRSSGKVFSLELPAQIPDWQIPLGVAGLVWAATARRRELPRADLREVPGSRSPEIRPFNRCRSWGDFVLALGVFAGVALWGISRIPHSPSSNDGIMMIKGLPYSDAHCWYEMSVSLAEGRGLAGAFDGQRPWYSLLMAMVHEARGVLAVEHGLLVNALVLGMAAAGLLILGSLMGSRVLGLLSALVLVMSPAHRQAGASLMTEMTGLALTIWSLALILTALRREGAEWKPGWSAAGLLVGGAFQALGNLACPYTLVAVPFYGWLLWREGRLTQGAWWTWRSLLPPAWLGLGMLLVLAPWVARQHRVHGLTTLSIQTADLLYGATFDEGPMKPRQIQETNAHLDRVGHSAVERYRYGMKRFGETVRANPLDYVKKLAGRGLAFFAYYNVTRPEPAVAALLLVLAVIWIRRKEACWWAWVVSGMGAAGLAIWLIRQPVQPTGPGLLLALAGGSAALAWLCGSVRMRRAVGWLTATLAGCALINALTGNLIASRCWVFCDWTLWLLVLGAVYGGQARLAGLLARLPEQLARTRSGKVAGPAPGLAPHSTTGPEDLSGAGRFLVVLTVVVLLAQAAGGIMLWHRQNHPLPMTAGARPDDLGRIREWAAREFAQAAAASGYPLQFRWVRLGEGACYLEANEEATRFSRAFQRQSWPRTLRIARGIPAAPGSPPPEIMVRIPGDGRDLPEDRPGLLVSWLSVDPKANLHHDEEIHEALAFLPGGPEGALDETQAIRFMRAPVRPVRPSEAFTEL